MIPLLQLVRFYRAFSTQSLGIKTDKEVGGHAGVPFKRIYLKFFCLGTPTWRPWRHMQTPLYSLRVVNKFFVPMQCQFCTYARPCRPFTWRVYAYDYDFVHKYVHFFILRLIRNLIVQEDLPPKKVWMCLFCRFRVFSEGGNFSLDEVDDYRRKLVCILTGSVTPARKSVFHWLVWI